MSAHTFLNISKLIDEIGRRAECGQWQEAAEFAEELGRRIDEGNLPRATVADQQAIENTLTAISSITERAIPLQQDLERLLSVLGKSPLNR